jgi:hypothetical protein
MGDFKTWLKGLGSAFIGGSANVITTMIVAPDQFNFQEGLPKVAVAAGVGGVLALANYLKQSPLPGEKK